jgi:hypothetical protein
MDELDVARGLIDLLSPSARPPDELLFYILRARERKRVRERERERERPLNFQAKTLLKLYI